MLLTNNNINPYVTTSILISMLMLLTNNKIDPHVTTPILILILMVLHQY